jgi:MoxR-like ATPase
MTTAASDVQRVATEAAAASEPIRRLIGAVESVVVGQRGMVEGLVIGLLTNGHVLLEGVPGLAKTLTVSTLAAAIRAEFKRLQFTPDLLPADLVGTLVYNPSTGEFTPRRGPIFANIVLADEINRAPAKVQSALLEAMQERQVTIGDETHRLPSPFLVLATQNPIEQEGTYPLPEAQVDRFMLKLTVGYPGKADERLILERMATARQEAPIDAVIGTEEIVAARSVVDAVYIDGKVKDYIVDVVQATREPAASAGGDLGLSHLIDFGASPRATLALAQVGRAKAFLDGRGYVTPQDIKDVGLDVLRHRIVPSYEAEAEGVSSDELVRRVLSGVPVP